MDNLKCGKCQKYLSVPIFICLKSKNNAKPHLQCGKCCPLEEGNEILYKCYTCNENGDGEIYLERNHLIEKVILQSKHSCIYEKDGCTFNLRIGQKDDHENYECFYRPFKCSMVGSKFSMQWKCAWIDKIENFYDHFREQHADNVYKYTSDKNELKIQVNFLEKSIKETFYLFSAHFRLFYLIHQFNPNTQKAYWTIQYIGPKNKSSSFYYEIEIFKINDPIRKNKVTEYCESYITDHELIFSGGKCVVISFNTLMSFVEDTEITLRFRVCKNNKLTDQKKSVGDTNIEKVKNDKTILNLQNNTSCNIGDVIGSPIISTNFPPLNLPEIKRTPKSKNSTASRY